MLDDRPDIVCAKMALELVLAVCTSLGPVTLASPTFIALSTLALAPPVPSAPLDATGRLNANRDLGLSFERNAAILDSTSLTCCV